MLRRTRADQVSPVFERFMALFPDARSLAAAAETAVAATVRPLGLAWRVPAFRAAAQAIVQRGGEVPEGQDELRLLPGVGQYVAAAVVSLGFDKPAVLVDTNTVRVAARYFGFPYHAESRRNRAVCSYVARLFDSRHPRESARAILDFAALVCRTRQPRCSECPVAADCAYFRARQPGTAEAA